MPLTAGTRLGSYEVMSALGAGGMGEVYRARHRKLGRDVAIKVLPRDLASDPERRHRFEREARAASALNHPNIVTIHDIDEHDGTHYIAMELVEGRTLRKLLFDAPLPSGRLLALARQIAEGLARAHAAGIVHRDLKPENLMVTDDGLVKILDFGLAKLASPVVGPDAETTTAEQTTRVGAVLGTVPYMSPEQASGRPVDFRSDQFSLGSILYEMATGRRAFQKETTPQTLAAIIEGEPEPVGRLTRRLPAPLVTIIAQCLAKKPDGRFASTRDLAAALQTVPETSSASQIRRRAARATAVLVVVGLGSTLLPKAIDVWLSRAPGAAAPVIHAVAVLPLQNLSGDPEQEYFADGMTEALITDLAKIAALKVISRSSAMRYKGTSKTLAQIARELRVDAVVEGSVVREGGRVGITAQLVEASTDRTLWADRYERELRSVLTLQGEIARAVARRIEVAVTPEEQTRLTKAREVDPQAYEAYLKGSFHLKKLTPEGIERGLAYLHEAVEKDPASPLAYAGLALGYSLAASHSPSPPKDAFQKAQAAYRKSLELDDTMAEGHAALAETKLYEEWDWPGAEKAFRRALELNPSLARSHMQYGWYLNLLGRQDEAVAEMRQGQRLDPLEPLWTAWIGDVHCIVGRYDEGVVSGRQAIELDPRFPWGYFTLGWGLVGKRSYDEAIVAHEKAAALDPTWRWALAQTYAKAGRRDAARKIATELTKTNARGNSLFLALIYSSLGDREETLRWIDAAIEYRHPFAPWAVRWVDLVELLHDHPRYQALRGRMGLASPGPAS